MVSHTNSRLEVLNPATDSHKIVSLFQKEPGHLASLFPTTEAQGQTSPRMKVSEVTPG